jgi:hypothetical protein
MTETLPPTAPDFEAIKQRQQQTWASGDFHTVAARIMLVAEHLVDAADLHAGWRVLDVATGSANAAIAAARLREALGDHPLVGEVRGRGLLIGIELVADKGSRAPAPLATSTAMVETGVADTVLLIGAEVFSRILDFSDRQTCVLFGDGAGAAIIQATDRPGIESTVLGADGSAAEILIMPGGGSREPATAETVAASRHRIFMPNGREVFKRAVTEMASACREVLEKNGHTADDVDVLIPHQANARIMRAVAERLHIPSEKAVLDVSEVGNTSAASIPIALDRAWRAGRIAEGDLVLFTSFGAGLTWGATVMRWTMPAPAEVPA